MRDEEQQPVVAVADDRQCAYFESMLASYARTRGLSDRQVTILRLHLGGTKNKEIGSLCGCSEATVHEHWRRMAKKIGGRYQEEVIADFHRFLGARPT
jgi:DNA-binding NarL/FixJ family response regulator